MSSEIRQTLAQAKAVYWLGRQLKLPFGYDLWSLLKTLRQGGSAQFYEPRVIRQSKGKHRRLFVPNPQLMALQHRINRYILNDLPRNPNAFGFRGGGCHELARRLSLAQAILKCDIKDAFSRSAAEWSAMSLAQGIVCPGMWRISWLIFVLTADQTLVSVKREASCPKVPQPARSFLISVVVALISGLEQRRCISVGSTLGTRITYISVFH